jgi:hypothetical protein
MTTALMLVGEYFGQLLQMDAALAAEGDAHGWCEVIDGDAYPFLLEGSEAMPPPMSSDYRDWIEDVQTNTPSKPLDRTGWFFAGSRFRDNLNETVVPAGGNFRVDRFEFWSPPYATNDYRVALPAYWTTINPTYDYATDANPSEKDIANPYNVEAVYLHAYIGAAWVSISVPNAARQVKPGDIGHLLDAAHFASDIPPNTRMMFAMASNVAVGAKFITGLTACLSAGRLEGARVGATTQVAQAAGTVALTGTDGRLAGNIFSPPWVIAKAPGGIDRPVPLVHGDSKFYGKNNLELYSIQKYLGAGTIARALDEDVIGGSRRMVYANLAIPSIGVEQRFRKNWSRKLDLIRKCPNRPYTHWITNSYNNGWITPNYRNDFGSYYDLMRSESRAWGNKTAPIIQERPIARANSSDWATTLAGQNPDGSDESLAKGLKWIGFDADLLAGYFKQVDVIVDANRDWAYDQAANRNKVKLNPKTYTLAADYVSNSVNVSLVQLPTIGDNLILDPAGTLGGTYVRSFTGTGPYVATIYSTVNKSGILAGTVVKTSYAHDKVAVHPSDSGSELMKAVYLEMKASVLAGVPA